MALLARETEAMVETAKATRVWMKTLPGMIEADTPAECLRKAWADWLLPVTTTLNCAHESHVKATDVLAVIISISLTPNVHHAGRFEGSRCGFDPCDNSGVGHGITP